MFGGLKCLHTDIPPYLCPEERILDGSNRYGSIRNKTIGFVVEFILIQSEKRIKQIGIGIITWISHVCTISGQIFRHIVDQRPLHR